MSKVLQALQAVTVPHADLAARLSLIEGPPIPARAPCSHKRKTTSRTGASKRVTEGSHTPEASHSPDRAPDVQKAGRQVGLQAGYDQVTQGGGKMEAPERAVAKKFDFAGTPLQEGEMDALICHDVGQHTPPEAATKPAFQCNVRCVAKDLSSSVCDKQTT